MIKTPPDFDSLEHTFISRDILTIEPLLDFLDEIGSPHKKLPPTIHVAGTNGKGSTIAMLRAIYETQGYKVHTITSPHLHCITERFVLASQTITKDALWSEIERYEQRARTYHLSWYELMIGISLNLCAQTPADVLLLEVGLGGEFDATNVIEAPILSMITPISLDHYDFLGDNLKNIAKAKAGIIKENCPVLSATQDVDVANLLKEVAYNHHSPFKIASVDKTIPQPNLPGEHQKENARLVIEAIEFLKDQLPVTKSSIEKGLQMIKWPGRLEELGKIGKSRLWFDVGHNPAATQAVQRFFSTHPGPKTLLFALLKSKEARETLKPLMSCFDSIVFFEPCEAERYHSSKLLQEIAQDLGSSSILAQDLQSALKMAIKDNSTEILIAGSHYISLEIREILESPVIKKLIP